jgi:hypothetical protein
VDWKSWFIYEGKINSLIPVSYTQVRSQLIQGLKFLSIMGSGGQGNHGNKSEQPNWQSIWESLYKEGMSLSCSSMGKSQVWLA